MTRGLAEHSSAMLKRSPVSRRAEDGCTANPDTLPGHVLCRKLHQIGVHGHVGLLLSSIKLENPVWPPRHDLGGLGCGTNSKSVNSKADGDRTLSLPAGEAVPETGGVL